MTDIKLCIDFSKLNKYIVCPVNPHPKPQSEIYPKASRTLWCSTPSRGIIRYNCSMILRTSQPLWPDQVLLLSAVGLNSTRDVFTLRYGNTIHKITNCLHATEDTLIWGSTTSELVENTRKFFDACRANGITLKTWKIQWGKKEVLFGGFILDFNSYRLHPALNRALLEFPTPANQLCNF
jgi:hypothetical protein